MQFTSSSIKYLDDEMCLCQCCDSNGNGCRGTGHRCQKLNYYSDYPSSNEFAKIWFGVGEMRDSNVSFGTSCSSLSVNENNSSTACL